MVAAMKRGRNDGPEQGGPAAGQGAKRAQPENGKAPALCPQARALMKSKTDDGTLKPDSLDEKALTYLRSLNAADQVTVLNQFFQTSLSSMKNPSAYLSGVIRSLQNKPRGNAPSYGSLGGWGRSSVEEQLQLLYQKGVLRPDDIDKQLAQRLQKEPEEVAVLALQLFAQNVPYDCRNRSAFLTAQLNLARDQAQQQPGKPGPMMPAGGSAPGPPKPFGGPGGSGGRRGRMDTPPPGPMPPHMMQGGVGDVPVQNYTPMQIAIGVRVDEFHNCSKLAPFVAPEAAKALQDLFDMHIPLVDMLDAAAWKALVALNPGEAFQIVLEVGEALKWTYKNIRNVNAFFTSTVRKHVPNLHERLRQLEAFFDDEAGGVGKQGPDMGRNGAAGFPRGPMDAAPSNPMDGMVAGPPGVMEPPLPRGQRPNGADAGMVGLPVMPAPVGFGMMPGNMVLLPAAGMADGQGQVPPGKMPGKMVEGMPGGDRGPMRNPMLMRRGDQPEPPLMHEAPGPPPLGQDLGHVQHPGARGSQPGLAPGLQAAGPGYVTAMNANGARREQQARIMNVGNVGMAQSSGDALGAQGAGLGGARWGQMPVAVYMPQERGGMAGEVKGGGGMRRPDGVGEAPGMVNPRMSAGGGLAQVGDQMAGVSGAMMGVNRSAAMPQRMGMEGGVMVPADGGAGVGGGPGGGGAIPGLVYTTGRAAMPVMADAGGAGGVGASAGLATPAVGGPPGMAAGAGGAGGVAGTNPALKEERVVVPMEVQDKVSQVVQTSGGFVQFAHFSGAVWTMLGKLDVGRAMDALNVIQNADKRGIVDMSSFVTTVLQSFT